MTRLLLLLALSLCGCQKATPQGTIARPHEAERLRTLTHDTDLAAPRPEADWSKLAPHATQSPAKR